MIALRRWSWELLFAVAFGLSVKTVESSGLRGNASWDFKKAIAFQKQSQVDSLLRGMSGPQMEAGDEQDLSSLLDLKGRGMTIEEKVCGRHGCNLRQVLEDYTVFHRRQLDFNNSIPHKDRRFLITSDMIHGIGNRMAVYNTFFIIAILTRRAILINPRMSDRSDEYAKGNFAMSDFFDSDIGWAYSPQVRGERCEVR